MSIIHPCERPDCKNTADDWHHKFHRHKNRLATYGKHLIDHPRNGAHLCQRCHTQYKNEYHYNEPEFIEVMGLWGFCKKRVICSIEKFPFCDHDEIPDDCLNCRGYEFDKDRYYDEKGIKENKLFPGWYGHRP